MSPYSANKSVMSSSVASSWMFVAITIQPSMLRTATAFWTVRASDPALLLAFVVSSVVGDDVPPTVLGSSDTAGGAASISISVDMGEVRGARRRMGNRCLVGTRRSSRAGRGIARETKEKFPKRRWGGQRVLRRAEGVVTVCRRGSGVGDAPACGCS